MSKKYLIIKGSARKNGYTNKVCNEITELLKGEHITIFDTYEETFLPCTGCNYCENNGKCVNRDLDAFYEAFESCDAVVFLSPVYNGSFSAPLKSLIDRFQVYYTSFYHNNKTQPIKKRREAIFVAASGRSGEKAFEYMKSQLECAFTILNVKMINSFLCANTDAYSDCSDVIDEIKKEFT
jgi:multimeric flavodoxin WrbA